MVNTSTHITKTPTQLSKHPNITKPTHTHTLTHTKLYESHTLKNPHITKQIKITTVQVSHQIK